MHSISNEMFNKVTSMYPIFEVVHPNLVYFKDKSISGGHLVFTENDRWVTVKTFDRSGGCDYILMNLFFKYLGGSILIQSLSGQTITKLSDQSCCNLFDYNIKIRDRINYDNYLDYDEVAIRRRFTINNIINE